MTPARRLCLLAGLLAVLSGCGRGSDGATPPPVEPTAAAATAPAAPLQLDPTCDRALAERTLLQCKVCHSLERGQPNLTGPNLFGVHGHPAGRASGFAYSPSMRDSGLVWDAANLDRFLANPQATMPNTRMAFGGVKDDAARAAAICYLEALH
jgi:cytochrome c